MNITSHPVPRLRRPKFLARALSAAVLIGGLGLVTAAPASADTPGGTCSDEHRTPGTGTGTQAWGSATSTAAGIEPGVVTYDVNAGYTVRFCAKGGNDNTTVTIVGAANGTISPPANTGGNVPDLSHWAWALVSSPTIPEPEQVEPMYSYAPPTCETEGVLDVSGGEGYSWNENADGTYTAVAEDGYELVGDPSPIGPFPLAQLTGEECDEPNGETITTEPPEEEPEEQQEQLSPVAPGPVSPPATQTPAPEAPETEALTPQAPTPAPAADPTQALLPSTGSTSGLLAAVAGLLMLAGFGLRRFGPQRIDQFG